MPRKGWAKTFDGNALYTFKNSIKTCPSIDPSLASPKGRELDFVEMKAFIFGRIGPPPWEGLGEVCPKVFFKNPITRF